jgi:hypothetical protein
MLALPQDATKSRDETSIDPAEHTPVYWATRQKRETSRASTTTAAPIGIM